MNHKKTILLCWELGGGSGHLVCLTRLAATLAARGHRTVLALSQAARSHPIVVALPAIDKVDAPPFSRSLPDPTFRAHSFADILAQFGFADPAILNSRVAHWRHLIGDVGPDLVLSDFSPFVCLAAKGLVRTISVGSGFSTPPSHCDPFPVLNPRVSSAYDHNLLTANAVKVATEFGFDVEPRLRTLAGLTSADEALVRCFSPFDPYQKTRLTPYSGPIDPVHKLDRTCDAQWPNRFFAYLAGGYPGTLAIVEALAATNIDGDVFVSSPTDEVKDVLQRSGLNAVSSMPDLNRVLPAVSVVVHHCGLGTAQVCAAAGVPQLGIPIHLEHELTGAAILRERIGACLIPPFTQNDVIRGVQRLMTVGKYREHAQRVAGDIARSGPYHFVHRVLERVEALP